MSRLQASTDTRLFPLALKLMEASRLRRLHRACQGSVHGRSLWGLIHWTTPAGEGRGEEQRPHLNDTFRGKDVGFDLGQVHEAQVECAVGLGPRHL